MVCCGERELTLTVIGMGIILGITKTDKQREKETINKIKDEQNNSKQKSSNDNIEIKDDYEDIVFYETDGDKYYLRLLP